MALWAKYEGGCAKFRRFQFIIVVKLQPEFKILGAWVNLYLVKNDFQVLKRKKSNFVWKHILMLLKKNHTEPGKEDVNKKHMDYIVL